MKSNVPTETSIDVHPGGLRHDDSGKVGCIPNANAATKIEKKYAARASSARGVHRPHDVARPMCLGAAGSGASDARDGGFRPSDDNRRGDAVAARAPACIMA